MAPNLDAMEPTELRAWWEKHRDGNYYQEIFPGKLGHRYRRVTADLAEYAVIKAVAMEQRAKGEIRSAMVYEDICAGIYQLKLPTWARW